MVVMTPLYASDFFTDVEIFYFFSFCFFLHLIFESELYFVQGVVKLCFGKSLLGLGESGCICHHILPVDGPDAKMEGPPVV